MSARVLVTGGTGFVGIELVRELAAAGWKVEVLARPSSDRGPLAGLPVRWREGDLAAPESLWPALAAAAAEGPFALVHNGALISYRTRDRALQERVNVEGTRALLAAAERAGARPCVHVGSIVAVGWSRDASVLDEDAPFPDEDLGVDYVRSKRAAEELALAAAPELDLRIVDPGAIFGVSPRPSNSRRFLEAVRAGRVRLAPPGAVSPVGLADVARGIRLALERGRAGRRYLLAQSHLSLRELIELAARLAGTPAPRATVPRRAWAAAVAAARLADRLRPIEHAAPQALACLGVDFRASGERARRELGWEPAPLEGVLAEALASLDARPDGREG